MKLRLVFKSKSKKDKEVILKLNIAPSKHLGFINFINLALEQEKNVELTFEKIDESGEGTELEISGIFQFQAKEARE